MFIFIPIKMYLLILSFVLSGVESGNILAFFTFPRSRHEPILSELSLEGHRVTVITPNPLKDESLTNLREIDLHEISHSVWNKYNISTTEKRGSTLTDLEILAETVIDLTDVQLSHPEVKKLIKNENKIEFDVCLVDYLNGILSPFMEIFGCGMITISAFPLQMLEHDVLGNINHPILYPDINLPFSKSLDFFERLQSVYHFCFAKANYGKIEGLMQKHFGKVWPVKKLLEKMSLVITNVNPLLHSPRVNIASVIEIKGLNFEHEKPLPNDLQLLMDDTEQNVIYIHLASSARKLLLTEGEMRIILNTIEELAMYRFLWKYEFKTFDRLPKNLVINNSFPQTDVLSHPNLKLFINLGSLEDLDEAIFSETPVVVLPFYTDQLGNARRIEDIGMGKYLEFSKLNKADLKSTILEVLSYKFAERTEYLYDLITDEPNNAHSEILWWIEYVLKNKGVGHMRDYAADMPFYFYYMWDVAAFLLVGLLIVCSLLVYFVRFVLKCYFKVKEENKKQKKN